MRSGGGIEGQRAPIKTKTGEKIRSRLVTDLANGAVIPPVVIGAVPSSRAMRALKKCDDSRALVTTLKDLNVSLSIIDGMQRTTALIDAKAADGARLSDVRVEFWFADKLQRLVYRMLVLNTGQVPWDLKRQLDTLYRPILDRIEVEVPQVAVLRLDESMRRTGAGEYQSSRVIELFLAFTSRTIDINIRERVAEEFTRIDLVEAVSDDEFFPLFIEAVKLLVRFDKAIERAGKLQLLDEDGKITSGKDMFASLTCSVGFMVAIAEVVFGPPGFEYTFQEAKDQMAKVKLALGQVLDHMSGFTPRNLPSFVDFDTLNQRLSVQRTSRIGEHERNFYKKAFSTLISQHDRLIKQGSLTPCWLA